MTAKARGAISPPDVGRFWRRIALNIATLPEKVPCLVPLFRRTLLKDFEQELEYPTNASRVWCCNQ
jgi:hypothetical protein